MLTDMSQASQEIKRQGLMLPGSPLFREAAVDCSEGSHQPVLLCPFQPGPGVLTHS